MEDLQSGDKIVELGAMFRSVTTAGGAISFALLLFLSKQSLGICFAGFFLGAIVGLIIGLVFSRLLYSDGRGNVKVVKAIPTNFPVTLNAALKAALLQTIVVTIGLVLIGKVSPWPLAIAVATGVNFLIAFIVARLSLS